MEESVQFSAPKIEMLSDVPPRVLKGLPQEVTLQPSAVDEKRLGVWATRSIQKGRKYGPFSGEKKKKSQVKNNVYMWEAVCVSDELEHRNHKIFTTQKETYGLLCKC